MPTTYLNGVFYDDPADAKVSAFDAAVQHGVGLFETMLAVGPAHAGTSPRIHRLVEHLDRLADSVRTLELTDRFDPEPLAELVLQTVVRSGLCDEPGSRARVRLTITGGDLNLLSSTRARHQLTVLIAANEPTPYPIEMFTKGVSVTIADAKLNPLDPHAGHKTINYWSRLNALKRAAAAGAGETLLATVSNHLAGGAVSNLFLVKDGSLLTPIARGEEPGGSLPSPVLPGITRRAILERAAEHNIATTKRLLTIDDLLDADEVFLTNSSWGVLPVVRVESRDIAAGTVGQLTTTLRNAWLDELT